MRVDTDQLRFLEGGGECGALIRAYDWSASPLGPAETWPQALQTLVGVMLGSHQPMLIVWGSALTTLYNDGYAAICGQRHPAALGRGFDALWHDIWDDIAPILERAYSGQSTNMDDSVLTMHRNGFPKETHFAFSYTPVRAPAGEIMGMFCVCTETTRQVEAERTLRQMTERQRRLFEQAPGFIAVLQGPRHVFEFINLAYARLFGGGRDLVGLAAKDAFPELHDQGYFEQLDHVYATGERFVAEQLPITVNAGPGGEPRQLLIDFIYEPIIGEAGAVTGIFVEGYEVTNRARAEAALLSSEEELRLITDGLPMLISYVDAGHIYRFANSFYERWFGKKQDEVVGRPVRDVIGEAAYAERLPGMRRALAGEHMSFDWVLPTQEGRRECHVQYVPRRGADGTVDGFYVMALDISERKAAETALRESEENYRYAAELNPQVAWTATPDGRIDRIAERWGRLTGTSGLGEGWAQAIHAEDLLRTQEAWRAACETGEPFGIEHRIMLRTGEYRWMHSRAFPRRDANGEVVKWYGSTEDINARRRATDALSELNETLEERVVSRTAELERVHEQLRHAQKIEALGQLTGGVAHDFNNLLMVISGGLDLMDRQHDPARRKRLHGAMKEAVDRGSRLTRQLLAFSRQQALKPQLTDLAERVGAMEELLGRSLSGNITIYTEFAPDLWPVEIDVSEFELLILNLAVNARDAMPGGGSITLGASNVPALPASVEGDFVRLFVADTGPGIAPEIAARVFEPFFTTKDIGKGSGLGLAQVYGFAVQSGGRVEILSPPEGGTTVIVWLPRSGAALPEAAISPKADEAPAPDRSLGRVLMVEDDDDVGMLVEEMLAGLGYEVTRAISGTAALAMLGDGLSVDLILSDIMMPDGISGLDMAREVRRTSGVPIILTSGYAEPFREAAEAVGLTVLDKPYRLDQLADALARHAVAKS